MTHEYNIFGIKTKRYEEKKKSLTQYQLCSYKMCHGYV